MRSVQGVSWVKTGGPSGGLGYDVRIHPRDRNIMFVTDNPSGVNKSYDGGDTWTQRNGGVAKGAIMLAEHESAEELPQRPPDTLGLFVRREDNRIFVICGERGIMYTLDGEVTATGESTEVEVVATSETAVYKDVTQESLVAGLPSGGTVEQKLEPGQVEEIGKSSVVMVWGEKRGERLVAEILVYTGPPVIVR